MTIPTRMPNTIQSADGGSIKIFQQPSGEKVRQVRDNDKHRGVLHTTETKHIDLDWSRGRPHLAIGPTRMAEGRVGVIQMIDFGWLGTALKNAPGGIETNAMVLCQIEQAGNSAREPWLPSTEQASITASVLQWCAQNLGIPETYPYDISALKTGVWAVESNPWRKAGTFEHEAGWHGHIAVPENDHWDPGAEMVQTLLQRDLPPPMVTAHQLVVRYRYEGRWRTAGVSPHFRRFPDLSKWMASHPRRISRTVRNQVRLDGGWVKVDRTMVRLATRQVKADQVR